MRLVCITNRTRDSVHGASAVEHNMALRERLPRRHPRRTGPWGKTLAVQISDGEGYVPNPGGFLATQMLRMRPYRANSASSSVSRIWEGRFPGKQPTQRGRQKKVGC